MSETTRKRQRHAQDSHDTDLPQLSTKRAKGNGEDKIRSGRRFEEKREQAYAGGRHDHLRSRSPSRNLQEGLKDKRANGNDGRSDGHIVSHDHGSNSNDEKNRRYQDPTHKVRTSMTSGSSSSRHKPSVATNLPNISKAKGKRDQEQLPGSLMSPIEGIKSDNTVPVADVTLMRRIMGFSDFGSTKNTKVPGNNVGCVRKDKHIKARQYMNRVGGFNRPLSPSR